MSSPLTPQATADDPVTRWQHIVESRSDDPALRARLDVVARFADATVAAAAGRGWLRPPVAPAGAPATDAGAVWSHVALAWYEVLTDAEALAAADGPPIRCRAVAAELREWLHGPDTPADAAEVDLDGAEPVSDATPTVADRLGLHDFDLYAFDKLARVTWLLDAAQDAGVFGVDGHRVAILHHAGDRGHVNEHRVLVTAPLRGILCSPPVDTVELLSAHLSGVDAAVHVLSVIAEKVEQALDQHTVVAVALWPSPALAANPDLDRSEATIDATVDSRAATAGPVATNGQAPPSPSPKPRAFRPLAIEAPLVAGASAAEAAPAPRNGRRR